MPVNIKLRRKFDTLTAINNSAITATITGTQGNSFLELKIPIETVPFNAGANANERAISGIPKTLAVLKNQVFISPVVDATAATGQVDFTSNLQVEISIIVPGKKPWDGSPL